MITILLISFFAFIGSAFFSGFEMAYLSCNKLKLRHMADEGNPRAKIIMRFHQDPKRFLTTVLIGNNLMNVTTVGLFTYFFQQFFQMHQEWPIAFGLSFIIIIFAETIPKDWFRHRADDFIYRFAVLFNFVDHFFSPISKVLMALTDILISATAPDIKRSPFVTREEFRYVIEESAKGGVLLEHERKLIDTILNLGSLRVEEVMIPVEKFPKVSLTDKVKDVKEVAKRTKMHAILVYEEIPSLIVGLIYVFDVLFEENEEETLSYYLRAPLFISQDTTAEKAIFLLQSKHASYGAVINPNREVIGVVGLENLIRF